jgi:peptide deformylase
MYKIVVTPNSILVKKAQGLKKFDRKLSEIIKGMGETLLATTDPVGVGLAAPQIGLPLAIFQMKPTEKSYVSTFINPKILSGSGNEIPSHKNSNKVEEKKPRKGKLLEGCLSIPNIWGHVSRKKEIKLEWHDEKGKKHMKKFSGFPAVIIQHEVDHLDGILFTKHVMEQKEKLYKSHKDENGEDVFDEVKL